ncbi:ABC transporter permease [Flagellimonas sp. S174]|uniref:ABC transporter permease n=1 Tax=Flagellimonas sp. S174 TaxID=3410790 RepID=UPI003BF470DD
MFKNYVKIAWRNLLKNKQQTIINVLGLTVGTVSCLAILLYVFAQFGYDEHHEDAASIFRVETLIEREGKDNFDTAAASPPTVFALKEDFPEVQEATRVVLTDVFYSNLISAADSEDAYYEPRVYIADSTFFKVFTYKFLEGNQNNALDEPNALVLSSSLANKLFGKQRALGKAVIWGSGESAQTLTVKGVFDDTYAKSHLKPNYIVSMSTEGMGTFVQSFQDFATNNFVYSYVKLASNSNVSSLQNKLPEFIQDRAAQDIANAGMDNKRLFLRNVSDIHLYSSDRPNQIHEVSNIKFLYFLLTLAFFIQLVACVNFINLSTARASKRAKEIGVRKVAGAFKNTLMRQFLGESLSLSLFAVLISIPITMVLLPLVNDLAGVNLTHQNIISWKIGFLLLGLGIITGLVSGIYPATVLSAIKPIKALKGNTIIQSGNGVFRKALVVFQFVISIALIATVIVITQQFQFTQKKDLGYSKDNLLALRIGTDEASNKFESMRSSFLEIPGVLHVSSGLYAPSEVILSDNGLYLPGGNREHNTLVKRHGISDGYFETLDIPILKGRDFTPADTIDQIIVNQATLKIFNINEEDALSARLIESFGDETSEMRIIGVVEDYHYASLKHEIAPLFLYKEESPNWLFIKTKTTDYAQLLKNLESKWKEIVKQVPFDYRFVDREVERMYDEEKRLGQISMVFTILAIFISCLGLFGLVSYVAEQKKKEIGIRKVLGASVTSVVQMLTKDFLRLVLIAMSVATPLAYYFIHRWLQDFSYRIELQWWVFAFAGGSALVITFITVGFQSLKSAVANPVKNLRVE